MAALSPSPTVDQVVDALNRSTPPSLVTVRLPGVKPLVRMLAFLVILILTLLLVLAWNLVRQVEGLTTDIRRHQSHLTKPPPAPLPAADRLFDLTSFTHELAAAPRLTGQLHLARAHLMATKGRYTIATAEFSLAESLNPRLAQADDRLAWIDCLLRSGDKERARSRLYALDLPALNAKQRQRAQSLMVDLVAQSGPGAD